MLPDFSPSQLRAPSLPPSRSRTPPVRYATRLPRRPRCSRWLALRSPRPSILRIAGFGGTADLPAASTSIMSPSPARPSPSCECCMPPALLTGCCSPGPGLPASAMTRFRRMARTDLEPTESKPRRSSSACSVSLLSCDKRSALLPACGGGCVGEVPSGEPPSAGPRNWSADPPRRTRRNTAATAGGTASFPRRLFGPPCFQPKLLGPGELIGGAQEDLEFKPFRLPSSASRSNTTQLGLIILIILAPACLML